ncbi:unnamed protein product [Oncorhynchus mykiss]|uniref:Uncharacterized protein n=1 Tax=Oncorhynchus mykiss TaxID=8022 RepID=A0A060XU55_ONCMY|nr:unnamed protein product [Oncorhynchus mykiss]
MVQKSKRLWYRLEQNAQKQKPVHVTHQSCDEVCLWPESTNQTRPSSTARQVRDHIKLRSALMSCSFLSLSPAHLSSLFLISVFPFPPFSSWTKERWVLLVKRRSGSLCGLFSRAYPQQYDMCVHVMKQKKCH